MILLKPEQIQVNTKNPQRRKAKTLKGLNILAQGFQPWVGVKQDPIWRDFSFKNRDKLQSKKEFKSEIGLIKVYQKRRWLAANTVAINLEQIQVNKKKHNQEKAKTLKSLP